MPARAPSAPSRASSTSAAGCASSALRAEATCSEVMRSGSGKSPLERWKAALEAYSSVQLAERAGRQGAVAGDERFEGLEKRHAPHASRVRGTRRPDMSGVAQRLTPKSVAMPDRPEA